MHKLIKKINENIFFISISGVILLFYYFVFKKYFPNVNGGIGNDYSYQLPNLLTGYYWFKNNGFFSIPWFSPAQCGGVPFYADPGFGLYSLPQFLTLFFNPLLAIKITFLFFAALGYFGFYFLLRRKFHIGQAFSVLGATIFLFNGFYAYRMIVGHPFHAFMLLPYLALLLLPDRSQSQPFFSKNNIYNIMFSGAILAYMFHSAMMHIIPPVVLSVAVILLIHAYIYGVSRNVWLRAAAAVAVSLGLSISKLVAAFSFLKNVPRDLYSIPGFHNLFDAINIIIRSLFFRPPADLTMELIVNSQWAIRQHELEFGVTWVPFVVILVAIIWYIYLLLKKRTKFVPSKRTAIYLGAIILLLSLPIAVNIYNPSWNKLLKSIPIIKNSFLMLRWFAVYIPVSILGAVLFLNSVQKAKRYAIWTATILIVFVIAYQSFENRTYYTTQTYDSNLINLAYEQSRSSDSIVPIGGVAIYDPKTKEPSRGQNDLMVAGLSQIICYNAIFGYKLEQFPLGDLHPGPALEITDNHFNIKNPSCYVFPKENNCQPGDHFKADQRIEAEKFLQYKPFSFKKSNLQKIADAINLVFLSLFCILLIYSIFRLIFKNKAVSPNEKK